MEFAKNIDRSVDGSIPPFGISLTLPVPMSALLIGVPEERVSQSGAVSATQTPLAPSAQTILLPSAPSAERQPFPVVLFCGAALCSLAELVAYVQCGVPVLVVQVSATICWKCLNICTNFVLSS